MWPLDQTLGSHYIARHPSAITIRKLWNKQFITYRPWGVQAHQGEHSKITGGERECRGLGFCFYWSQASGRRGCFVVHSLLANLKHMKVNLKHKKNKWPKWSVIKINQGLSNKGASVGELAWLFIQWGRCCVYSRLLWSRCAFEMDALAMEAQIRHFLYKKRSPHSGLTLQSLTCLWWYWCKQTYCAISPMKVQHLQLQ